MAQLSYRALKSLAVYLLLLLTIAYISAVTFGENIGLASTYAICAFITLSVCAFQVRSYGLPSWRAGIPLYYLIMFFIFPAFQQATGFIDYYQVYASEKAWILAGVSICVFSIVNFMIDNRATRTRFFNGDSKLLVDQWPLKSLSTPLGAIVCVLIGTAATLWSLSFGYYGLQIVDADRRSTFSGVVSTLTIFLELGSTIAWCQTAETAKHRRTWLFIALISTAISLYFSLYSNSKFALLKPIAIMALSIFAVRRSLSLVAISFLVASYLLVIYPFITSFRVMYDNGNMNAAELFSNSAYHLFSLDWFYGTTIYQIATGDSEAFGSIGRGLFKVFASIIDATDAQGTTNGSTFLQALYFMVPRYLWPGKPEDTVGNLIGHFTGLITEGDTITNISPTQFGEWYMNFGIVGMLLGTVLWAIMSVFIDRKIVASTRTWLAVFFFFYVMLQESTLGQGVLSLVKSVPIYLFVIVLINELVTLAYGKRQTFSHGENRELAGKKMNLKGKG